MKCIVNAKLILKTGIVEHKCLLFDETIRAIADRAPENAEIIDARGGYAAPGLIDLHCHGLMGLDASSGDYAALVRLSEYKAGQGVTSWLPTTMTLPWPALEACFAAARRAMADSMSPQWTGAQVLGVHAEGPFISVKRKGAQDPAAIQTPDIDKLRPWADVVRLMTVAPEVPGAPEFIRAARALGVKISMGHTDATAAQAQSGIDAGATQLTHTFNAMPPLHHREPGVLGAAFADERVYCELIADTFHVSPLLFPILARLKPEKLILITDSIPVAGLPDGPHQQLGVTVVVDGIRCRFPDGTIAGSALTLDQAVQNFHKFGGVPLWQAVNMASLHPARALGLDHKKGALQPGLDADILLTDAAFNPIATFVAGRMVWGGNLLRKFQFTSPPSQPQPHSPKTPAPPPRRSPRR